MAQEKEAQSESNPVQPETQPTPQEEKKPTSQPTSQPIPQPAPEKQTNCLACKKPLQKLKVYYRNGKFYCNKRCWEKVTKKPKEEKE